MKKLIFDCDNTFGVPGCDVDDGLALFYLLGSGKADLLGITTTYGNGTLEVVDANTRRLLHEIGREDIPVHRGCSGPGLTDGDAAAFLVEMADRFVGELNLLATGAMTNLHAAYQIDNTFFTKVQSISLMGGITAPLIIGNKTLGELNFTCDPEAALSVLTHGKSITVASGNVCLGAFFEREQTEQRLHQCANAFGPWLSQQISYWFDHDFKSFGHPGIFLWDVYAAACLLEPEWFSPNESILTPTIDSLRTGQLLSDGAQITVKLPAVLDEKAFTTHIIDVFLNNHFVTIESQTENGL